MFLLCDTLEYLLGRGVNCVIYSQLSSVSRGSFDLPNSVAFTFTTDRRCNCWKVQKQSHGKHAPSENENFPSLSL